MKGWSFSYIFLVLMIGSIIGSMIERHVIPNPEQDMIITLTTPRTLVAYLHRIGPMTQIVPAGRTLSVKVEKGAFKNKYVWRSVREFEAQMRKFMKEVEEKKKNMPPPGKKLQAMEG